MQCNGKCYLAKQLKEQQKEDHQVPINKKAKIEIQLFNFSESSQLSICTGAGKAQYSSASVMPLSAFPRSVFHPPSV